MAVNPYSASHKQWDHVGNITPGFEHSEGIRPHFDNNIPAGWLPVVWEDKHYEVWVVISSGKIVALTLEGDIVPAGLKVEWAAAAGGDTVLTYTSDDVEQKVTDLTTGEVLTAATDYTKTELTAALKERGLIGASDTCDDFISDPIGVIAHNAFVWWSYSRDKFNPVDNKQHNHQLQHAITVLCDWVVRVPWLASDEASDVADSSLTSAELTFGSNNIYSAANTTSLVRYSSIVSTTWVAYALDEFPVAEPTDRTPIEVSSGASLTRRRQSVDQLSQDGDYFLDLDVGVIFFYSSAGTLPSSVSGKTYTYHTYASVPTTVSDYISATGTLVPGCFVKADADSNYTLDSSPTVASTVGQVLGFITHPRDFLDRVRTQYTQLGTMNKMPGTATKGFPANLNISVVGANKEVVINLINR